MEKTERFQFWLSSDEKNIISLLAGLEGGLSQAALIRRLIHLAAEEHGITSKVHRDIGAVRIPEIVHKEKDL